MDEKDNDMLTKPQALVEASRCLHCFEAPCQKGCPAGIDVPRFIRRIATEDFLGAAETILEKNPLGEVCARVCPAEQLCQKECSSKKMTNGIRISKLQAFALAQGRPPARPAAPSGRKVAIIGGGPSGLAAAHALALQGHSVTLYEKRAVAGGVPRAQIPHFRLEPDCMPREMEAILALDVQVKLNTEVDAAQATQLVNQYDALYLATGLTEQNSSLDMSLPGLCYAEDFLERCNQGQVAAHDLGDSVVVIGGGNTAMDAACAAKLLGVANVTVLYRRTAEEMPAWEREYHHALMLGVNFAWQTLVLEVQQENGALKGLRTVPAKATGTGEDGRDVLRPNEEKAEQRTASYLISALGSRGNTALAQALGLATDSAGRVQGKAGGKVFAGGDCQNGGSTVVQAVAEGRKAAAEIHALLSQ